MTHPKILFPTYLWEFTRDTSQDLELWREIERCEPPKNNVFNLFEYTTPRIAQYQAWVEDCLTEVCSQFPAYRFDRITRCWVNTTHPNDWETPHTHDGAHLAATYYLFTPHGCGDLHLIDPRPAVPFAPIDERGKTARANVCVPAQAGKLVIFPANIVHFVPPNLARTPRVSITLNAKVGMNL